MLKTRLKPKPEANDSGAPDFSTAKARFEKATAAFDAKREAVEDTRAAIYWSKTLGGDRATIAPALRERVARAYPQGVPRHSKLVRQAEAAADALEDATPGFDVERELYAAAARRETGRIAQELQPRHKSAVRDIATALEALSRALAAESEVRAELAATAPEARSAYLPNCSGYLAFGSLADWNSPASQWAREMRKLGILD